MAQAKRARQALEVKLATLNASAVYAISAVRKAAHGVEVPTFGRATWDQALAEIFALERATKAVRAIVRAGRTAEVRAACEHPADRRVTWQDGSGRCRACGLPFKRPAPSAEVGK